MKRTLLALIVLLIASTAQAQSLKDTLQWMQNTLRSGGGSLYISLNADGATEKRELTMPSVTSCEVSFLYQTGPLEKGSFGVIAQPAYRLATRFNLRDIDPTTVTAATDGVKPTDMPADIVGPYTIFSATTRDSAESISHVVTLYPAPVTLESYTTDSLIFELPYPYAERFTKAFKHAVTLCGGKPSTF